MLCISQNWNLTWGSENPDFTPCFEQTVLIWIPCAFLWLFLPLEIMYMKCSITKDIPFSFWNVSKLVISIFIILLTVVDLSLGIINQSEEDVHPVHIYTPLIKIITMVNRMDYQYFSLSNFSVYDFRY